MSGRWVVFQAWSVEPSLSGYDTSTVLSTHDTEQEALADRRKQRHLIGEVKAESKEWCIGLGIAPEPEQGYAPQELGEDDLLWAREVPDEVLAWSAL